MIEVTCAVILKDGEVLIAQRSEVMSHPLQWEFPGGKIKTGESPEKCLIREIKEELSISVKVEQLLPSVTYSYEYGKIKLIPFICSLSKGEIALTEHKSYKWINRIDLPGFDILPPDIRIIESLNGQFK